MAPRNSTPAAGLVWLFDVDGTLTPAQGVVNPAFATWLQAFSREKDMRIVSGGDRTRILRQLGRELVANLAVSYNSLGNSVWMNDVEVARLQFEPPRGLTELLLSAPELAAYPGRRQGSLSWKNGMLAFSLLGDDATSEERLAYRQFDAQARVRQRLADRVMRDFPSLSAQVAGDTSVDLFPRGKDKSQVLDHIAQPVYFFADRTAPGGNDHSLAQALHARNDGSRVFAVDNWEHTWSLLRELTATVRTQQASALWL